MSNPFSTALSRCADLCPKLASIAGNEDESETLNILLQSLDRWARDNIDAQGIDKNCEIPEKLLSQAKDLGLFGLTVPEEYGGAGLSMKATACVMEKLSFHDRSVATTIGLHAGLGLRGLLRFGSDQLKKSYLPSLATGEKIAAFAATEANAGSDLAAVRATAEPDGDNIVLNGEKVFITNGGFAGLATVYARTPGLGEGKKAKSLIFVPLDAPGVSRGREEHKLGIRGTSTTSLIFDSVVLPKNHIVGMPGKGSDHIASVLSWGRAMLSAGSVGSALSAYRKALEYVATRRQFNRPLVEFGIVRERIADMRAKIFTAQSLVRLTAQLQDDGQEDISWESAVTKTYCTEMAWDVADGGVQLHGGMGFIEETGAALPLRDARIGRIFEGANELMRVHASSAALGWRDDGRADWSEAEKAPPLLSEIRERTIKMHDNLVETISAVKQKYGARAFLHQIMIGRLADMLMPTYAAVAVFLRTWGEMEKASEQNAAKLSALCGHSLDLLEGSASKAANKLLMDDQDRIHRICESEIELLNL